MGAISPIDPTATGPLRRTSTKPGSSTHKDISITQSHHTLYARILYTLCSNTLYDFLQPPCTHFYKAPCTIFLTFLGRCTGSPSRELNSFLALIAASEDDSSPLDSSRLLLLETIFSSLSDIFNLFFHFFFNSGPDLKKWKFLCLYSLKNRGGLAL